MLASPDDTMLDRAPRQGARQTERLCAATGQVKPIDELIRFVIAPDGSVVPDVKRRLPGRGVWITATRAALERAIARKVFARAFKQSVRVAADLAELTEHLLVRAALDRLAICHKAGAVAIGFAKVEAALARDRVAAVLNASDAALEGVRKVAAARNRRTDGAAIGLVECFTSAELDLALGRANVVHAALLAGPESGAFLARTARLENFRAGPGLPGNGQRRALAPSQSAGVTDCGGRPGKPQSD